MNRTILVYNPHSSNYARVKDEIFPRLTSFKGSMVGKYAIKKAPFEDNVATLKKLLKDDDFVIAAGGDATAAVAANAILGSNKSVTFCALPYGNFNDLARTLGTMNPEDIFKTGQVTALEGDPQLSHAKMGEDKGRQDPPYTKKLYPLDIIVDGKHWRYATCYVTMGMTAESVALFDEPKFRKYMQKGHKSSWRSYLALVKWYFKNRHSKQFIPDFTLNGTPQHPKTSDYAALSGRSMCRVMKGGDDYLKPKVFRSTTGRLTNFWQLFKLMVAAILVRTPGTETKGDIIKFDHPATVALQAEGEYHTFKNINTIEVRKCDKCLTVIHR